jgi:hypothetical protein
MATGMSSCRKEGIPVEGGDHVLLVIDDNRVEEYLIHFFPEDEDPAVPGFGLLWLLLWGLIRRRWLSWSLLRRRGRGGRHRLLCRVLCCSKRNYEEKQSRQEAAASR